jgi:hypothetical protein
MRARSSIGSTLGVVALTLLPACGAPSSTDSTGPATQAVVAGAIIPNLPATPTFSANTVPPNGDVNPYGVAFVPTGFPSGGTIHAGDLIVANFNNKANLQGTGTTVVRVKPHGRPIVFYSDPTAPGFSTALGVLSAGFVLLGNVPSSDGSGACVGDQDNVGAGSLMIIDKRGKLVQRLTSNSMLNGPWDLTVDDNGSSAHVFVSNVNTGTVTRVDLDIPAGMPPTVTAMTQIASDYTHACNGAAFVVGPTGLAFDPASKVLYVASTGDNSIFAVSNAADRGDEPANHTGDLVIRDDTHFHGPLAMARANNGDLITSQGDAVFAGNPVSAIVETAGNMFVAEFQIDPSPGSAFGLALKQSGASFTFAAVDDGINVLDVWVVP